MKIQKKADDSSISYNFLVLGDQMVGKTSVLERYINRTFKTDYILTIGMDKRFKRLEVNNVDVDIFITDTAGQERFRALTKMFYKNTDGILVGFSLTDQKSLESVGYWINQIKENCKKDKPVSLVLFGNKCDDKENIKVNPEDIEKIKNEFDLTYFETSAKENINVTEVFEYLTKLLIMKRDLNKVGLKEGATIDDIVIKEKENQKIEIKQNKPKKKKIC